MKHLLMMVCFGLAGVVTLGPMAYTQEAPGFEKEGGSNLSADAECQGDRRCRIERLKRQNQARRFNGMLKEDQMTKQMLDYMERTEREKTIRLADPLSIEYYYTFLGHGLGVGYLVGTSLRVEGTVEVWQDFVSEEIEVDGITFQPDVDFDVTTVSLFATYLWGRGSFIPYTSAGVYRLGGTQTVFDFDNLDLVMHGVQVSVGFDTQFKLGLRGRLGVMFRQPVYKQASFGPGEYSPEGRELLDAWFSNNQRLTPEFSMGWAF